MRDIFISHSSDDSGTAGELRAYLQARNPGDRLWYSSDPVAGPVGGEDWQAWIHRRLSQCDLLVFVATEASTSPWCSLELGVAQYLGKPIIPVLIDEIASLNPIAARYQGVVAAESFDHVGRAVDRHLSPGRQQRVPEGFVPYPGLDALDEGSRSLLAGREDELGRLVDDFDRLSRTGGLVVVSGPSGSGKSSLVGAGLVPALRDRQWRIIGPVQPLKAVTGDLISAGEESPTYRPHVIMLDQAEEALQLASEDADRLFAWIASYLERGHSAVVVVRSEFRAMIGDRLPGAIDHFINNLTTDDLEEVIRLPARLVDLAIDDDLVNRLVDETGSGEALPLLAYTLRLLWERRDRVTGSLRVEVLDELGGVAGVLHNQAERALRLAAAGGDGQDRRGLDMLSRLATPNQNPPTRSPERAAMFTERERRWLDEFVEVGLVSYRTAYAPGLDDAGSSVAPTGERLVDVTHEKLFDWQLLRDAITRNRDRNADRKLIDVLAKQWSKNSSDDSLLIDGRLLRFAREDGVGADTPDVRDFVAASRRRRLSRQARALTATTVTILGAFAIVAGLAAWQARGRAVAAEEAQRAQTEALELATASTAALEENPALALALAAESTRRVDPPLLVSRSALVDAGVAFGD